MYNSVTESEAVVVTETMALMSDGVRLYTRVAVPRREGKLPIILIEKPEYIRTLPFYGEEIYLVGASYLYDTEMRHGAFKYQGIFKAMDVGAADGVISFVSDEITEEISFCGRMAWHLTVSSDREDTALFCRGR